MNTYLPSIPPKKLILGFRSILLSASCLALFASTIPAHAQQLGWEGETGVFVTPLAYTVSTGERKFALPVVSYHYLYGGSVLGASVRSVSQADTTTSRIRRYAHHP